MLAALAFLVCSSCGSSVPTVLPAEEPIPLVLVPGFLGQRPAGAMGPYFVGWRAPLERAGAQVFEVAPPPVASSEERGAALVRSIDEVLAQTGATRVVLLTHSQGGLDARVAIDVLAAQGRGEVVAAVATLAAPHSGTGVADTALRWPRPLVRGALRGTSALWRVLQLEPVDAVDVDAALEQLSTPGAAAFQRAHPTPSLPFFSVAGISGEDVDGACEGGRWRAPAAQDELNPALVFGRAMDRASLGELSDDGVVPTRSMRFGTFLGCVAVDHVDWQGWDQRVDPTPFVVELWRALDDVALAHDASAMDRHLASLALAAHARPLEESHAPVRALALTVREGSPPGAR